MNAAVFDLRNAVQEWAQSSGDASDKSLAARDLLSTVETLLESGNPGNVAATHWHEYLEVTGRPSFQCLPNLGACERWAETAFRAIRLSGYSLRTMLEPRAHSHPKRIHCSGFGMTEATGGITMTPLGESRADRCHPSGVRATNTT